MDMENYTNEILAMLEFVLMEEVAEIMEEDGCKYPQYNY